MLTLLLDAGADAAAQRKDTGATPLHAAAANGHRAAYDLLLIGWLILDGLPRGTLPPALPPTLLGALDRAAALAIANKTTTRRAGDERERRQRLHKRGVGSAPEPRPDATLAYTGQAYSVTL